MNAMVGMLVDLGLSLPVATAVVVALVASLALRVAAWLLDLPEPGLVRCAGSVLGSGLLAAIAWKLLAWIPWVGPLAAGIVAWFLAVATIEELTDTTLDRAAVALGVAGSLVLTAWVAAQAIG